MCLIKFINRPSEKKFTGNNGEHNKKEKIKDFLGWLWIHCSGWSENKIENEELENCSSEALY